MWSDGGRQMLRKVTTLFNVTLAATGCEAVFKTTLQTDVRCVWTELLHRFLGRSANLWWPHGAGFSCLGCLTQAAPPLHSFLVSAFFLSALPPLFLSQNLFPPCPRFQLFGAADFCLNGLAFSCICLQGNSSFYNSSLSLRSSSDPARLPCAARRVGGWLAVCRMQHVSLARTSPRRVAGLVPHGSVRGQSYTCFVFYHLTGELMVSSCYAWTVR